MSPPRRNPWAVLIALCLGFFMTLLDTTVVGVAIPSVLADLRISYTEVLWVSNAYVLALAVFLIVGGRLGDLFGRRRLYLVGVALFTVSSLLCALSQDAGQLIAARLLQGLGAALLVPQTMSIIVTVFPPERRGAAFGVWGAVAGVATIAGPPLGGFLIDAFDWRWIFLVNLPIGVLVLLLAPSIIPAGDRSTNGRAFDVRGALLSVLGISCLTLGLQEGQRYAWGTVWSFVSIPMILAVGLMFLVLFVIVERRPGSRAPLVPSDLFRSRSFSLMNFGAISLSIGIMSMAVGFQLYAQSVLGMSPLEAGLASAPLSLLSITLGPYAGRLADKTNGKFIVFAGLSLFALGLVAFNATTDAHSSFWSLMPSMVIVGAGLGLTFAPLTTVAMSGVQPQMAGAAAGMLNSTRQLGSVLGTAGFGVLLQYQLANVIPRYANMYAAQLPAGLRQDFVGDMQRAAGAGLEFDRLRSGGAVDAPTGTAVEVLRKMEELSRGAFSEAFVDAMHQAMLLPVFVLILGAVSCLFAGRGASAERALSATDSSPAPEPGRTASRREQMPRDLSGTNVESQNERIR